MHQIVRILLSRFVLPEFMSEFICEQWVGHSLNDVFNFLLNEKILRPSGQNG